MSALVDFWLFLYEKWMGLFAGLPYGTWVGTLVFLVALIPLWKVCSWFLGRS